MKHYLNVFFAMFNLSSKRYLEYRWNALGYTLSSIFSLVLSVVFINIYFSFSGEIQGWNKYQVLFLVGLYKVMSSLFTMFFFKSVAALPEYMQKGELDIFLLKPISSQFYISFRLVRSYDIITALSGFVVVFYALNKLQVSYTIWDWVLLLVGFISGLTILYSIYFLIATLSIWLIKFDSINDVYFILRDPLSIPTDFFSKNLQLFLTFIIPLGIILTIPVRVFIGKSSEYFIILCIVVAMFSIWLSNRFWKFALKSYTSASS